MQSGYSIPNFVQRQEGYLKAIEENRMSPSRSVIHRLSPSIEAAIADMLEIIERKNPLAMCYFADNDIIAIDAMKELLLRGYRIPEDIACGGSDNISESRIIEPSLTTIDVPRHCLPHCRLTPATGCDKMSARERRDEDEVRTADL